jgi:hypothetical protein
MREFHRKIIHQLVKHNKTEDLIPDNQAFFFSTTHWILVLLEAIHSENVKLQKIASSHLKIDGDRPLLLQRLVCQRMIKVLILYCDSRDFIAFFEWCKAIKNSEGEINTNFYVCFRGELLKEVRVWDEYRASAEPSTQGDHLPITAAESVKQFEDKFSGIFDYITQMYREEQSFELTFTEVFGSLRENIRKRKIEAHAEYVVAEMVLEDKVLPDILKYVLRQYIETD